MDTAFETRGQDGIRRVCQIVDVQRGSTDGPSTCGGCERRRQTPAFERGVAIFGDDGGELQKGAVGGSSGGIDRGGRCGGDRGERGEETGEVHLDGG